MPNQYTKAKELGLPKPVMSDETREKVRQGTIRNNAQRWLDPKYREKFSNAMKQAVQKYPESYGASNRGRTKRIDKHGVSFQGKWELEFFEWCLRNDVLVERPSQGFSYTWEGLRTYFPDFYLPKLGLYVEVKGYETERDRAKWKDFPHTLLVVRKADITKMKRNEFILQPNNP